MQMKLFPTSNYDEKNFESLCEQAIRLLIFSGEQAPVELFLRGLKHSNSAIRVASIAALLHLNAQSHLLSIRSLLQDEKKWVQETAAWALACWEEPVPRELLAHGPSADLREWVIEVLPPNWSHLFPLRPVLECVSAYRGLRQYLSSARLESEISTLFQRLAKGIGPQPFIAFLQHPHDYRSCDGACKILTALDSPLPLDILPTLLSQGESVGWETALLVGKHRIASASDLLGEMWALTVGKTHAAITIALDDLGKIDAVSNLLLELQSGASETEGVSWGLGISGMSEAEGAIWGLGILGQRGRAIPRATLHQMLQHPVPQVRAQAIRSLSSLDDMSLEEALAAVNDSRLEPVIASCQAFLALAHTGRDIPVDLLIRELIDLQNGQSQPKKYTNGYVSREALITLLYTLDELHADVPLDILLDTLAWGRLVEPLVIRYWRRHDPGIFVEMMVQAEAFLQQHL